MAEKIKMWLVGNTGLRNPNRIQEGFKAYANSPYVGKIRGEENEIGFMNFLYSFVGNGWWLTDLFLGRFSRMLIVFIGLNVLLKILRLFGNDKFLLYKMFFVVIKTL